MDKFARACIVEFENFCRQQRGKDPTSGPSRNEEPKDRWKHDRREPESRPTPQDDTRMSDKVDTHILK